MNRTLPVIAIDGPAASGKGTIARRIAEALGFALLDTGALYRAVALSMRQSGADLDDPLAATEAARALTPADIERLTADPELRTDETAAGASRVSAVTGVRLALLEFQRSFAANPPGGALGAVLDGRDIGTVICPDAPVKLFVTASVEVRAQRRFDELASRGEAPDYEEVLADMQARDERDSQRAIAPLIPARDSVLLDNSGLDAKQSFDKAMEIIRARLPA